MHEIFPRTMVATVEALALTPDLGFDLDARRAAEDRQRVLAAAP